MHPFSLTEEQIKQVSGGLRGGIEISVTLEEGGIETTMMLGEEGGIETTLALGEEGGFPPPDLT